MVKAKTNGNNNSLFAGVVGTWCGHCGKLCKCLNWTRNTMCYALWRNKVLHSHKKVNVKFTKFSQHGPKVRCWDWELGSLKKNAYCACIGTWVQIPNTHVRSQAWLQACLCLHPCGDRQEDGWSWLAARYPQIQWQTEPQGNKVDSDRSGHWHLSPGLREDVEVHTHTEGDARRLPVDTHYGTSIHLPKRNNW